jgi:hypothetical protein
MVRSPLARHRGGTALIALAGAKASRRGVEGVGGGELQ